MEELPPGGQALEVALKTFAFGRLPRRRGAQTPEDAAGRLDCVDSPCEIPGAPGFTTLTSGGQCCLGITPEGDVHRWVAGSRGTESSVAPGFGVEWSLSILKDEGGHRLQLRDIALGRSTGRSHLSGARVAAVALMDSGDVFTTSSWYADGGDGSTGSKAMSCPAWRPVPSLQSTLVVGVACGAGFCMALTASGELLAWGESVSGALGLGLAEQTATEPTTLHGLANRRVAAVACGSDHVVAATFDEEGSSGAVYSWGLAAADGRLGYVHEKAGPQAEPCLVPWITAELGDALSARRRLTSSSSRSRQSSPELGAALPLRRSSLRTPQRITQVSCGARHSVVLCQGSVVCFGADDEGQLGRAGASPEGPSGLQLPAFAVCPDLLEEEAAGSLGEGMPRHALVRRLCCGPLHTAAVSAQGNLHVWGLDLRSDGDKASPAGRAPWLVPSFGPERPVVALACGAHFVVCSAEVTLPRAAPRPDGAPEGAALFASAEVGSSMEGSGAANAWRPANLPPKREEESEHHRSLVRELERSVQRRLVQEQREEQERLQREARREKRMQEHTEIWLRELLPPFVPGSEPTPRMQRLWRQGLPPRVREVLWPLAIGNVLRITPELFEIHKERALAARHAQDASASNVLVTLSNPPPSRGREQSTTCIPFDLPRTFPTLAFFCEGGPLHEDCARILEAYTFFRPDIGYVQGMSFLAAMLLLYLPPYQSFVGLCNLLNTPSVLGLYTLEPRAVACRARVFGQLCAQQLPEVAHCIVSVGLTAEMFLIEWFMTIFSKCLNVDVASVVWDLFLLDGEVILYCTALALLRILERPLLHPDGRCGPGAARPDLESCSRVLSEELRSRVHDPDELLWHIAQVRRRAPQQLLAEIRAIENTEFGAQTQGAGQRTGTAGYQGIGTALPGAPILSAA
eukprot:TRINITY_DN49259_c0_g1_i1.p1 TRINITY_DN49259_c0_g1~~TRINITY_DN49259_c0_g1_i1.p1  ORF type:complete len:917 (-),score=167.24 TRINITY_DN49259_c0_g1_i1:81-2831(-)